MKTKLLIVILLMLVIMVNGCVYGPRKIQKILGECENTEFSITSEQFLVTEPFSIDVKISGAPDACVIHEKAEINGTMMEMTCKGTTEEIGHAWIILLDLAVDEKKRDIMSEHCEGSLADYAIANSFGGDFAYWAGRALEEDNVLICNNVFDYERHNCYSYFAAGKGDISFCEKIKEVCPSKGYSSEQCEEMWDSKTGDFGECYANVAGKTQNKTICEEIKNEYGKSNCYRSVAEAMVHKALVTKDETFCEKIDEEFNFLKYNCYTVVAVETKDKSICNNIDNEIEKKRCYNLVEG